MPTYQSISRGSATSGASGPAEELDSDGTTLTVDATTAGGLLARIGTTVVSIGFSVASAAAKVLSGGTNPKLELDDATGAWLRWGSSYVKLATGVIEFLISGGAGNVTLTGDTVFPNLQVGNMGVGGMQGGVAVRNGSTFPSSAPTTGFIMPARSGTGVVITDQNHHHNFGNMIPADNANTIIPLTARTVLCINNSEPRTHSLPANAPDHHQVRFIDSDGTAGTHTVTINVDGGGTVVGGTLTANDEVADFLHKGSNVWHRV
jgi:hypothetical protein